MLKKRLLIGLKCFVGILLVLITVGGCDDDDEGEEKPISSWTSYYP